MKEFERIEKTRSAAADDGCTTSTFLAADDQWGRPSPLRFHHSSTSYSGLTSEALATYDGNSPFRLLIVIESLRNGNTVWTVRFRESSDRAGALSCSSNDSAEGREGADVDSAELVQEECCWDSQESDSDVGVAIAVIVHEQYLNNRNTNKHENLLLLVLFIVISPNNTL